MPRTVSLEAAVMFSGEYMIQGIVDSRLFMLRKKDVWNI